MSTQSHRPLALIILDGWGYRENHAHNPTQTVNTPTFDYLYQQCPYTLLQASGLAVGLPDGQMGNSEVGHLHIGAGRKVPQDLTRINQAIEDDTFFTEPALVQVLQQAKAQQRCVHLVGLLSSGGVHSLDQHIAAMIKRLAQQGITQHCLHAILDGRDTPPRSAQASIEAIETLYQQLGHGKIASLIGRYYAMDRDKRWDRTAIAYDLFTQGKADFSSHSALAALAAAYERGQSDEFIKPIRLETTSKPAMTIQDGDVVIFMNFRADRARQLSYALTDAQFSGFKRNIFPKLSSYLTLTEYAQDIHAKAIFAPLSLHNTLGEYLCKHNMTQLRIAETEKYAHVTYFMNGGREQAFASEDRVLIPSPKVATYDLQPQMSAQQLTEQLIKAIESKKYDVIICNYANPDMVGHTGIEKAAAIAVSTMDQCLNQVIKALGQVGGEALITADHGNIECLFDEVHQQAHTAHTNNPVPLFYVGRPAKFTANSGALDDIAPTVLYLLGMQSPKEMTGQTLIKLC